jgi:hypothetical protein
MTRDDMIKLAREAGWEYANGDDGYDPLWRFAKLVAAAEREACAKVAESYEPRCDTCPSGVANAIRARGQG